VGDQSLVAIKTDTVLGEKSLAVTPRGGGITAIDITMACRNDHNRSVGTRKVLK
jgi:hypothetical protein